MKKKAGQAQGSSRSSEVRNTSLVPANNSGAKRPLASGAKTAKPAPSVQEEFDYKSLGKSLGNNESYKRSPRPKTQSVSPEANVYGFSPRKKGSSKSSKKNFKGMIIAAAAAVLLLAGAIGLAVYYISTIEERYEVTLSDGSVKKITAEDAYAELMTDKFYSGIIIDGVDVGGMTYEEAFNAVSAKIPVKPVAIDVKLNLNGKKLPLDFSDATFEYNTRQILDEAYAMYRPVSADDTAKLVECYNNVQQLKNTPRTFQTAYTVHIDSVTEKINQVLKSYVDDFSLVKNATIESFDTETKEFVVSPEKAGYDIDINAAAKAVKDLFDSNVYTGEINVPTVMKEPEITEAMLRANFGLVGEEWTKASANSNRNNNIDQACEYINGTILQPGDTFSFNKTVKERTADRGFKEATVIAGGQYEQGLGGGICQASTTLYNAVLKANLRVVERNHHAWPSDYISTGLDATVDWPGVDFQFQNDTDYPVIIVMWFDWADNTVISEIYGKKLPNGEYIELYAEITSQTPAGPNEYVEDKELPVGQTKTIRQAHQGITANVYKIWYNANDEEIKRELYNTTTYSAYGERIGVGVLNPDGTYAKMDKNTGEITSPIMTVTPTPVTDTPTPTTAAPTDPPTTAPDPPTTPPDPPTTPPDPPTETPDPPTETPDPPTENPDPPPPENPGEGG